MADAIGPEDFNIKIKGSYIKGIKTFLLVIIPIALLVLNIIQFYYPHCSACGNWDTNNTAPEITAAASEVAPVVETEPEEIVVEPAEVEEPEVNETADNTTEEEEEEIDEDLLPITGNIKLTIDKINYDNKGSWAKVTKVKFTIVNQKEDLTPRILVYGYDKNYDESMKDYVEEEIVLPELKAGASVTKESAVSITFNDLDVDKTIKLELTRDGGNTVLEDTTKSFKIA